jgi:hypothetical protein
MPPILPPIPTPMPAIAAAPGIFADRLPIDV